MNEEPFSVELIFALKTAFEKSGHKALPSVAKAQSRYLRENSPLCLSGDLKTIYLPVCSNGTYTELQPLTIAEIELLFEDLYHDAKPVFDALKDYPDLLHQFRELYKND